MRIVKKNIDCTYGLEMEKTREERESIWFESDEVIAGCEGDEVVCLMG